MARSKKAARAASKKKSAARPKAKAGKTAKAARRPNRAGQRKASRPKRAQAVPAAYGSLTAHLIVSPATDAIAFYVKAFGAKPGLMMDGPGGIVMHGEVKIGDSILMLADEQPAMGAGSARKTPKNLGGTSSGVMLYVKDVDATYARAIEAGATSIMPPQDMFWGDRYSQVEDPFGHIWAIATHQKDMTAKQMKQAAMSAMPPPSEA
jgi:PhnB protein